MTREAVADADADADAAEVVAGTAGEVVEVNVNINVAAEAIVGIMLVGWVKPLDSVEQLRRRLHS